MRKVEKYSFGWIEARNQFENSDISIRQLALKLKRNEKTVRLRAKAEKWERNSAPIPQSVHIAEATAAVVARLDQSTSETVFPLPSEIARETCGTLAALRAHLDTAVQNLDLIRELTEAETAGDENPARARLLDKVLSLPGLIKAANDLTSAVARLADIGPGKKATAADKAKAADTGLFATPSAPNRETLQ